jgi:hypothetical protein
MNEGGDELRALIREVIRDVLPNGLPIIETVYLFTDEDLEAFVARLLNLDPKALEDLRAGRKRFRLAVPSHPQAPQAPSVTQTVSIPAPSGGSAVHGPNGLTAVNGSGGPPARRIERGAVTEKVVRAAARAGERLVLGPRAVLTPLARDRARATGVEISRER